MSCKPKIFFDTAIPDRVIDRTIPEKEWYGICEYISATCDYYISINTLYELVQSLQLGSEAYFERNRERIRILHPPTSRLPEVNYLCLVGDFVRSSVFGLPIQRKDFHPNRLKDWGAILLNAKGKKELISGSVVLEGIDDYTFGFNLGVAVESVKKGKDCYVQRAQAIRMNGPEVNKEIWAVVLLSKIAVPITRANAARVAQRLDAAYEYDIQLGKEITNTRYDASVWASDWIDGQQLFYLAHPDMYFVTQDKAIKRRIRKSLQYSRVLLIDEFRAVVAAGQKLPILTP